MVRPGLCRTRIQSASPPQSSDKEDSLPSITTTVRRRRPAKNQSQPGQKKPTRKRARVDDEDHEEDEDDNKNVTDEQEDPDLAVTPNMSNYRELGMQWGLARAEKYLGDLNIPKNNRPSGTGLYEAQSLQSSYEIDKTMLCIFLKVSQRVINEALLEGPLAREPNMYTNYQTYSTVATSSPTTSEAYALTQTPLGITSSVAAQDPPKTSTGTSTSGLQPLTQEEVEKFVPVFERLVNLKKVSQDLHQGRLWRHSGKSNNRSSEWLMKHEIGKLCVLQTHFSLQFHLMVACLNPATSTSKALFQDEYTSCERWVHMQKKTHLLERFTFESTKAPQHLRVKSGEPKPQSASAARQAEKRSELSKALNDLIAPYLRKGYLGKGDAHPKCPNLREAFDKKTFRGDLALTFSCAPNSQVTDLMLSKGPSCLTNDEVDAWIDDNESKKYTIIRVDKPKKNKKDHVDDCHSNSSTSDSISQLVKKRENTPKEDMDRDSASSKCNPSLDVADAEILAELTAGAG
ncbi:uncharacterized protein MELLADRAFT_68612 [Melampsora larici-populina 98AG31]|uniref:Uncharacterized protein n=1 Tax=Melampsora larici-populina (strain 98AG31 / pathotype 3-4-7) TaxID=747676 RepID=F4S7F4_MELLP|nr:uncharacterized protein MELLADRAFT_68612 [Melampsora larici-populina 98AG31]EGF99398.1 hypothetical protein MELLADRAFT_68612 [Melampsora larici-populina 98AG31]